MSLLQGTQVRLPAPVTLAAEELPLLASTGTFMHVVHIHTHKCTHLKNLYKITGHKKIPIFIRNGDSEKHSTCFLWQTGTQRSKPKKAGSQSSHRVRMSSLLLSPKPWISFSHICPHSSLTLQTCPDPRPLHWISFVLKPSSPHITFSYLLVPWLQCPLSELSSCRLS